MLAKLAVDTSVVFDESVFACVVASVVVAASETLESDMLMSVLVLLESVTVLASAANVVSRVIHIANASSVIRTNEYSF